MEKNEPVADSSHSEAKDYIDFNRELLVEGDVRLNLKKEDAKAEADVLSGEAREQLEKEYESVKAVARFLSADQEIQDDLKEEFLDAYARKVFSLAMVTEYAERKGYLPADRLYELPPEERQAVYEVLSDQYREINGILSAGELELTSSKMQENPVLYHSAEALKKLAQDFPDISPGTVVSLMLNNKRDPEGAINRLIDNTALVQVHFPEFSNHTAMLVAYGNPLRPLEAAERVIVDRDRILEELPGFPAYAALSLAVSAKNPRAEAANVLMRADELLQTHPDLGPDQRFKIAFANRGNSEEAANTIMAIAARLAEKFPQFTEKFCINLAINTPQSAEQTAPKILEAEAEIAKRFPDMAPGYRLKIASLYRKDPIGSAERVVQGVLSLAGEFPDVPTGYLLQAQLSHAANPRGAVELHISEVERLGALYPDVAKGDVWYVVTHNSDAEPALGNLLATSARLEETHPDLAPGMRMRIARNNPDSAEEAATAIEGKVNDLLLSFPDVPKVILRSVALNNKRGASERVQQIQASKERIQARFSWLTERSMLAWAIADDHPYDADEVAETIHDRASHLLSTFPELTESSAYTLSVRYSLSPQESVRRIVESSQKLAESHPQISESYRLQLAMSNPKSLQVAADRYVMTLDWLAEHYPQLSEKRRQNIAYSTPHSYDRAAQRVLGQPEELGDEPVLEIDMDDGFDLDQG